LQARLLSSAEEFSRLIEEIDSFDNTREAGKMSLESFVHKINKTSMALNQQTESNIMERYGIQGVNLDNIEEVYNPNKSGIFSM
jgi:hypothetical protein